MFLRSCLKNIDYMEHASLKTLNKLAFRMKHVPYEINNEVFKPNDICDNMICVLNGLIEVKMNFDNEQTVVERLGKGSLINSFNFIVEEELQLTATIASKNTSIYQISKSAFFDIVIHDKKLLKQILKMLIKEVRNLDPPQRFLDFIKPVRF